MSPPRAPAQPPAEAWLSDAELGGLIAEGEDDARGAMPWGYLVDMLVWAACAACLVWALVTFLSGITR